MSDQYLRSVKIETAPMKEETVLFNPVNNKFCVLNATAAFIWQSLAADTPRSTEELASAVAARFANVSLDQAESDVKRVLQELRAIECVVSLPDRSPAVSEGETT